MQMDSRIPLAGEPVNVLRAMQEGTNLATQTQGLRDHQAMQDLYRQHGAGILAGDQNALNALAGRDPMQALQVQSTRQGMRAREQEIGIARENARLRGAEFAAQMSAQQRQEALTDIDRAGAMMTQAQTPEQFAAILRMPGVTESIEAIYGPGFATPENRDLIIAGAAGLKEALAMNAPKESESEQKIGRLMATGMDRDTAVGIVDGRLAVSRDPVKGTAQIVDKATGKVVGGEPQQQAPVQQTPNNTSAMPEGVDFNQATGASGFISNLANTLSDAVGMGLVDPNNEQATQAMNNLATNTMISLAGAVAGRPSNFLLEQFERLSSQPNSVFQGEGRTKEKLNQTRAMLQSAIQMNQDVIDAGVSPSMTSEARANIARLTRLMGDYDAVIASFGARGGGNKTKSGVSWSVVE